MSGMSFLNAPLLWGLALATVPILIHLLFRRRFRRIEWAPMRYLKLSIQKNRRRYRIEQLLLLALRTAIVLAMFFMLARPVMHAEGLAGWLAGRSRTSQLLVLGRLAQHGRPRGRPLGLRSGPRIGARAHPSRRSAGSLYAGGGLAAPAAAAARGGSAKCRRSTAALIAGLTVSDTFVSWKPVLEAVDELVTSGTFPIREVTLITDLRRSGWNDELAELGNRWADSQVRLRILDVGSDKISKTSRSPSCSKSIASRWPALRRAMKPRFATRPRKTSTEPKPRSLSMASPAWCACRRLHPGGTAQMPLVATLQEAGLHQLSPSNCRPTTCPATTLVWP